jgi:hypothetical protein
MAIINANQKSDRTTKPAAEIQGNSDSKASREPDADTRNFIATHDVTKVKRKAIPGSGEESADLSPAAQSSESPTDPA